MQYTWRWHKIYQQTRSLCHLQERFISQQGNITIIFSDNDTNLVGAEKELRFWFGYIKIKSIQYGMEV